VVLKNIFIAAKHRPAYRLLLPPRKYKDKKQSLPQQSAARSRRKCASGVGKPNQGLGVVLADFNNDGWTDIAIATIQAIFLFLIRTMPSKTFSSFPEWPPANGRYELDGHRRRDSDGDAGRTCTSHHLDSIGMLYHNNHDGTSMRYPIAPGIGNKAILLSASHEVSRFDRRLAGLCS